MRRCGQVNIPQVDNTSLECEDFVSSKCVLGFPKLSYVKGVVEPTLYEVLEQIDANIAVSFRQAFRNQDVEIHNLRSQLEDMRSELARMRSELSVMRKEINILR